MTARCDDLDPPDGDADALLAAAVALAELAGSVAGHRRTVSTQSGRALGAWWGSRSSAFVGAATDVGVALRDVETDVVAVAAGLRHLGHRLREATEEVAEQRRRLASGADLGACAATALAAKADYARAAAAFAASLGASVRSAPPVAVPLADVVAMSLAPPGPEAVRSWWADLTAAQRRGTEAAYPELVGGLDGLPGRARDRANRRLLPLLEAQVRRRLADLAAGGHGYEPYGRGLTLPAREAADLAGKLRAFAVLRRVLALPGRRLLVLDPWQGHELHAAVAVGDVDTARHVAVFVPGMGSSVEARLIDYDAEMVDLRERSGAADTATITWLGYDAPQLDDVLTGRLSVVSAHLARVGGDRLAAFLAGVRPDAHLTVLGHSYGSVATGYALRHPHTGVDDVVLFGSPGAGVDDVGDLHVPAGHLWDLSAPGDPVAAVERFGTLPSQLPGFRVLATGAEVTGHTHYLDPHTTSQHNIAAVLSGHPEHLLIAPDIAQPKP